MKSDRHDGGVPARRAIVRWAGRLFRREWRRHLLILSLLTVTVAMAVAAMCAAHKLAPASAQAKFGTANNAFLFNDPDPTTLPAKLEHASDWFGRIDAIGHRDVAVPGTPTTVDMRTQNPDGAFGRPMLRLRSGRYPTAAQELAATPWLMSTMGVDVGETFQLDGRQWTVVGSVENPSDLGDRFVLLPYDLLASSDSITMLVKADADLVDSYRPLGDTHRALSSRGDVSESLVVAILMLVATTLVLLLVALVAAASFAVIAQRRLPQLGMLAAVGATEQQVRLTMLADGVVTGATGAVLGVALGLGSWIGFAPAMEAAVGSRIDRFDIPWLLVLVAGILATATATLAAWWPGRSMSRLPPVVALSGRTPRPAPLDRSVAMAVGCLVVGAGALRYGSRATGRGASTSEIIAILAGTLAIAGGVLLISPLAVRAVGRLARRSPVATRMALRDLGRHQGRSGAALAAISLALGIPIAVVATAAAAENNVGPGNLSSTQFMLRPADLEAPFIVDPAALPDLQAGADAVANALAGATPLRLDVAVEPGSVADSELGRPAVSVNHPVEGGWEFVSSVYVADDALLAFYGLDAADIPSDADVLTVDDGPLNLIGAPTRDRTNPETLAVTHSLPDTFRSLPGALVTRDRAAARGWDVVASGRWLVQTDRVPTAVELNRAREVAAASGLSIEVRDNDAGLTSLRLGAVAVGMLLALAVLAMTVGLIRSESAGDLRTLTAAGATSTTRRNLTAVTAGALALLGAVLGTAGAYVGLVAGQLSHLTPLPLGDLTAVVVGTPLVATAAAWLLAGREPPALARAPMG
jgi:putative ABC transport system permease protein